MLEIEQQKAAPEVLRAAKYAPLAMRPHSNVARKLSVELVEQLIKFQTAEGIRTRRPKADAWDSMVSTIAAVVAELLTAQLNDDAEGFCYRQNASKAITGTQASYRAYMALQECWPKMGLLEVVSGFRGSDDWEGEAYYPGTSSFNWATRIRATQKLLDFLAKAEITPLTVAAHFIQDEASHQPIILRSEKKAGGKRGKQLPLPDTPEVHALVAEVNEINAFLGQWDFNFGPAPLLYRIYNDGDLYDFEWDRGGRLFGPEHCYLNWSPALRKTITINGSPVTEIDVSACQLTLLYGLEEHGFDPKVDPYQIDGLEREEAKKMVNLIIGLGYVPHDDWGRGLSLRAREVKRKVVEQHPILHEIEQSGWSSSNLQSVEADIMVETLLRLSREHQIPALPVHDCIIVRQENIAVSRSIFEAVFQAKAGASPRMSVSS